MRFALAYPSGRYMLYNKTKTPTFGWCFILLWRTTDSKNLNTLYPEIIKMAEYIGNSTLLDLIYQISQRKEDLADSFDLNATDDKNTVYKGEK